MLPAFMSSGSLIHLSARTSRNRPGFVFKELNEQDANVCWAVVNETLLFPNILGLILIRNVNLSNAFPLLVRSVCLCVCAKAQHQPGLLVPNTYAISKFTTGAEGKNVCPALVRGQSSTELGRTGDMQLHCPRRCSVPIITQLRHSISQRRLLHSDKCGAVSRTSVCSQLVLSCPPVQGVALPVASSSSSLVSALPMLKLSRELAMSVNGSVSTR